MKNKDKYDLRNIRYVIKSNNGEYDFVIYHNSIEIYRENFYLFSPVCNAFTKWLEEEYVPNILTDKEKAYLSAIIKPFRERFKYIKKLLSCDSKTEYIWVYLEYATILFPPFKTGAMYKGMEENKKYTLEELGL